MVMVLLKEAFHLILLYIPNYHLSSLIFEGPDEKWVNETLEIIPKHVFCVVMHTLNAQDSALGRYDYDMSLGIDESETLLYNFLFYISLKLLLKK